MIRRSIVAVVAVGLVVSASGPAGARSLRIRYDGNDSPLKTDIRRVISDLSTSTVFLRIDTWQRFHRWDRSDAYFIIRLDARGDRDFDRVIEIYPGPESFVCLLEKADGTDPSEFVGDLRARRANARSVSCTFPRSWFPRIQRAVRFYVLAGGGNVRDRAPNSGLYRWL